MSTSSGDEERGLELIECEAYTTKMQQQRLFDTASDGGARGSGAFGPPERDPRRGGDETSSPADAGASGKGRQKGRQKSSPADAGAKDSGDTGDYSQDKICNHP